MKSCIVTLISMIVAVFVCLLLADFGTFSIAVNNGPDIIDLICIAIFIFILCFIFTFKYWNKTARKNIITCIVIYCCINVFSVYTNFGVMCIKRDREGATRRACWSNIRIIAGAVDFYNMDNSVMMESLDLKALYDGGYLGEEFSFPSDRCYYTSIDNLTNNGFVCCTEHFSPNSELGSNGDCIEYDLNADNYVHYISPGSNITFEKIKELKEKFKKAKESESSLGQRDFVMEQNKKIRAKKPFLERARLHIKENRSTYVNIFYPVIVLFFPYILHPLK